MAKQDWSWDQHKYKAKEWVNGKWQYIYNTAKTTSKKAQDTANKASQTAKVYVNNGKSAVTTAAKNTYNTGKSAVTTAVNTLKNQTNTGIEKTKEKVNSEIEAIKQAKEDARKAVEENKNVKALPAAAVVGIALLSLIATRMIITAAALVYASNEAAKQAKKFNNDNKQQREAAKSDNRETKAKDIYEDQKLEIMSKINPNYNPKSNDGWANNCYSCTLAYDMARRGYDAKAINDIDGATLEIIESCYQDPKLVDIAPSNPQKGFTLDEQKELINNIKNDYPDGAYGNFCVTWTPPYGLAGGHSIVWEKVNGEVIFRDCQTNKIYSSEEGIYKHIFKRAGTAYYFRTDNLEVRNSITYYVDINDQNTNKPTVSNNITTFDNISKKKG